MKPARKHNRLPDFDYSREEIYFVTSCVQDMACVFGEVVEGEMRVNAFGKLAERQWHWLEDQYPYLVSHAFVVMPNHVHGLLEINQQWVAVDDAGKPRAGDQAFVDQKCEDQACVDQECGDQACVGTGQALSVLRGGGGENLGSKVLSLSQLMGAFKTLSSKAIRQAGLADFAWKRSFHDHIIRNEKGFRHIKDYIENNPARWNEDTFRI